MYYTAASIAQPTPADARRGAAGVPGVLRAASPADGSSFALPAGRPTLRQSMLGHCLRAERPRSGGDNRWTATGPPPDSSMALLGAPFPSASQAAVVATGAPRPALIRGT